MLENLTVLLEFVFLLMIFHLIYLLKKEKKCQEEVFYLKNKIKRDKLFINSDYCHIKFRDNIFQEKD